MVRFINTFQDGDEIVVEVAISAISKRAAKVRGTTWILNNTPATITSINNIRVIDDLADGGIDEYRVVVRFDNTESVRNKIISRIMEELT